MGLLILIISPISAQEKQAHNPIGYADVPDMSIIRVGDTYYFEKFKK
jgi:beta-xylosidase